MQSGLCWKEKGWHLQPGNRNGIIYTAGTQRKHCGNFGNIYRAVLEVNPNAGRPCFGEIPYADGQVMYLGADIRELTEDTGFMPEVSFADGIREVIAGIRVEG